MRLQRCTGMGRIASIAALSTVMAVAGLVSGCGDDDESTPAAATPTATNAATPTATQKPTTFEQTNLVADTEGVAAFTDPNLVNPWGIASAPTGPLWVSDGGTGVSTVYLGSGEPFPVGAGLVVTIPLPEVNEGGPAKPTGIVFNGTGDFVVSKDALSGPALFIFVTEDGTISGWSQTVDVLNAILVVDQSGEALYKGLALASSANANYLYATNFEAGTVDVYDKNFAPVSLAGNFTDPSVPAGFAPFGIQLIDGSLFVTYAKQDDEHEDDVPGAGNGYVAEFNTNGTLLRHFASQGTLNSPWGLAIAPTSFGTFKGALLVGNFGDGRINAFDRVSRAFLGQLSNANGTPISIEGLWGLIVGNGGNGGEADEIYFTAGPGDEEHGLLGDIGPNEP